MPIWVPHSLLSEDPAELDSVKKALTSTLKKNTKGIEEALGTGCRAVPWLLSLVHTHLMQALRAHTRAHTHTRTHTHTHIECLHTHTDTLVGIFEHVDGEDEVLRDRALQFVQELVQSLRGEVFGPGRADNERKLMENIKKVRGGAAKGECISSGRRRACNVYAVL